MAEVEAAVKVGLVIDGAEVAGADGTYPVLNPVRPDEIVLTRRRRRSQQLDTAVAAARSAQPAWAALGLEERAAVMRDAAAGAVEDRRPRCDRPAPYQRARQDPRRGLSSTPAPPAG